MSSKITKLLLFVGAAITFGCSNPKKRPVDTSSVPAIERHQKKLKSFYDNSKTTPLSKEEKRAFEGIHFFPIDTTYIVKAHFERLKNQEKFQMPTTGEKEPWYIKYAKVTFDLHEKTHELIVYQNLDLLNEDGYEDYLFLPFLDETNGEETYGGGRYLDVENPYSDTLVLNFNLAYHPYCAYAAGYSCPIVPLENYVETRIESGVKF
ncbi:MAG TPA: DUF1684 domain-containing protein [Flavobacterium sp.]|nr:DUF1684 domain-containing protein [Flavobacterium sp.]